MSSVSWDITQSSPLKFHQRFEDITFIFRMKSKTSKEPAWNSCLFILKAFVTINEHKYGKLYH
jgi:hypothetical protein